MAGPMQMPSTPTSPKAFYIMWVVTLVLAVAVGVAIAYIIFENQSEYTVTKQTSSSKNTQGVSQSPESTSVRRDTRVADNLIGIVKKRADLSLEIEEYYTSEKKTAGIYRTIQMANNVVCYRLIKNETNGFTPKEGSCLDINNGNYIQAFREKNPTNTSVFTAKYINYSDTHDPFLKSLE